ncbi:MAG: hypothetical protein HPY50_10955 [Firmicutes bacterium]|nr:hypothetical protein [Bacillota bacterium]
MGDVKICRRCGSKTASMDRFCGECGFDTLAASNQVQPVQVQPPAAPPPNVHQNQAGPPAAPPQPPVGSGSGSRNALIIMIAVLAIVFLGGGGLYWWFSREEGPTQVASPSVEKNTAQTSTQAPASSTPASQTPEVPAAAEVDLSRASTYLSEPGIKCTFFVNYPDGTAGVVERVSARVVPAEAVRVSEVETGVDMGEAFGHGFHYVERPDGTYYIMDQTPMEIFPVLKNNLYVGQTWDYQDEFGKITWTVVDMGVDLKLDFTTFEDCLLVKEDNQAAEFQSVTYYAPGRGIVRVRNLAGSSDYYKMTAYTRIDEAQAAGIVKKWSPNHADIRDDRTQY